MKIKYAAYIRKSTEDAERQVLSKEAQKEKILEYFPDLDIEWFDDSKSAFKPYQRQGFQKMMDKVHKGEIQGLVAWHPDRLSRNEVDASSITWALRQSLLKDLKFASFSFDNSAEGIMMLQMTMSHSQYFSAKLSKDVKRGVNKKLKDGGLAGVAPVGYINNKADKTIEKDPDRFDQVKSIFHKFLAGYTVMEIHSMLEQQGFNTIKRSKSGGKPLSRSGVYKVLTNPRYYGRIPNPEYPDDPTKMHLAKYLRMISRDQFEEVQVMLGKNGRTRYVTKKHFELKGLFVCGECGCSITAERKSKTLKNGSVNFYNYYHCTHKRKTCLQRGVTKEEAIFSQLDEYLKKYTITTDLFNWAMKALQEISTNEIIDRTGVDENFNATVVNLEKRIEKLLDLVEDGTISKELYKSRSNDLEAQLSKAKRDAETIKRETRNWFELVGRSLERLHRSKENFAEGDLVQKKDILLGIGYNSTLKDGVIDITPYDWLKPLVDGIPELETKVSKVITNKNESHQSVNVTKKDSEESLMSSWQGHVESNHDPRFWRPIY